jgi:hypothetical protein
VINPLARRAAFLECIQHDVNVEKIASLAAILSDALSRSVPNDPPIRFESLLASILSNTPLPSALLNV